MNIAQTVEQIVQKIPVGKVFGYQELPKYGESPAAVIKAVNRLVDSKRLTRLSKGKFYVAKPGVLAKVPGPSESELLRSMLYKNGKLRGYVTGLSLFNQLGLTTQVPRTITLAINGGRQIKEFGTIKVTTQIARIPIEKRDVPVLQYLDALKDIKRIPDADINLSLKIIQQKIQELSPAVKSRMVEIASKYYGPQVKALLGLLLNNLGAPQADRLKQLLNPSTTYELSLDPDQWPSANKWNIR